MNYIKDTLEYLAKFFQWWIIVEPWEMGLRTRFGKNVKLLNPGIHFRIPFFDIVYVQSVRLRVVSMAPQTVTTADGKTLTLVCAVGYSISDLMLLYKSLASPDVTISNIVQAQISKFVSSRSLEVATGTEIEAHVQERLSELNYGIKFEYVKMIGYAVIRAYRLIQDSHWIADDLKLTNKQ